MRDWQDLEASVVMQDRTRRPELGRRIISYQDFIDAALGEEA